MTDGKTPQFCNHGDGLADKDVRLRRRERRESLATAIVSLPNQSPPDLTIRATIIPPGEDSAHVCTFTPMCIHG